MESHWIKVWEDVAHMTPPLFLLPRFQKKMSPWKIFVFWLRDETAPRPAMCLVLQKKKVTNLSTCPQNVVDVVGVATFSSCLFQIRLLSEKMFVVQEFVARWRHFRWIWGTTTSTYHGLLMVHQTSVLRHSALIFLREGGHTKSPSKYSYHLLSLGKLERRFWQHQPTNRAEVVTFQLLSLQKIVTEVCKFWESICLPGKKSQFV